MPLLRRYINIITQRQPALETSPVNILKDNGDLLDVEFQIGDGTWWILGEISRLAAADYIFQTDPNPKGV